MLLYHGEMRAYTLLAHAIHKITLERFTVVAVAYALVLLALGKTIDSLVFFSALFAVITIVYILKVSTRMPRPASARVESRTPVHAFPSGHAALIAFLVPTVTYTAPWGAPTVTATALAGIAFVVVLTRLYLKVHRPYEVLAGLVIGAGVPLAILNLLHYLNV